MHIRLIALLACVLFSVLLSGCSSEKKSENKANSKAKERFDTQKKKDAQRQLDLAEALLDEKKQLVVFNAEHVTFLIENAFGAEWKKAFRDSDRDRMLKFHFDEFSGTTIKDRPLQTLKASVVTQRSRTQTNPGKNEAAETKSKQSVDADGLIDYLLGLKQEFSQVDRVSFRVLQIAKPIEQQPLWKCRIQIDVVGESQPEKPKQYESIQTVIFEIENESEITAQPVISEWTIENEVFRDAESYLTREVTKESLIGDVKLANNWELEVKYIQQYWLQFSVEDFDRDGQLDIGASCHRFFPRLFYNAKKNRFIEVSDEKEMIASGGRVVIGTAFGCAWLDFNNDGYPDLINGLSLFESKEGKVFTDIYQRSGLELRTECMGVQIADYDCDGLVDIYALYQSKPVETDPNAPELWIRETLSGAENQLWKNMGGGRFVNVTKKANAGGGNRLTRAANWFFYDDDHYPDLFIANDFGKNVLLRNKGDGTFEDISEVAKINAFTASNGVSAGDLNNDGVNEIFVANMYSKSAGRVFGQVGEEDYPPGMYEQIVQSYSGNQLFTRDGDQAFKEVGKVSGTHDSGWAFGPAFVDFDGDGLLDIYATSGFMSFQRDKPDGNTCLWRAVVTQPLDRTSRIPHVGELAVDLGEFWVETPSEMTQKGDNLGAFERNRLYLNAGNLKFIDASFASGCDIDTDSRTAVGFDYDNDGDEDILVGSVSGGALRLFENSLPNQNSVKVRLKGIKSNSLGIGSRITFQVGDQVMVRDLFPSGGFMGSGPAEVLLGLGQADQVDEITVRWPTGEVQKMGPVKAKQVIQITEGESEPALSPIADKQ